MIANSEREVKTNVDHEPRNETEIEPAEAAIQIKRIRSGQPFIPPTRKNLTKPEGPSPVLITVSSVQRKPIRWLWPGRLALGKLSLISGDPGTGKSHVTIDMAARITRGAPWPDGTSAGNAPKGHAILLSAEDDIGDTIGPRLEAAGADLDRVHVIEAVRLAPEKNGETQTRSFSLLADVAVLDEALKKKPETRLVVIDPISAYLPGVDSHKNTDTRGALAPLAKLAAIHMVAIVCVTHLNKAQKSKAMYRSISSIAFVAAARAAWAVTKDEENPDRRLFLPVKNNLAKDTQGLAYTLEPWPDDCSLARVVWDPNPIAISADEAMNHEANQERYEWQAACEWLADHLAAGPVPANEVLREGRESGGFSVKTIRKAGRKLGVKHVRDGYGRGSAVSWKLPDAPIDDHTCHTSPITGDGVSMPSMQSMGVEASATKHEQVDLFEREERAAILEFDAGLPRTEAEATAASVLRGKQ